MILWIALIVVALVFVFYYNKFIVLGNRIDNSLSQINVQLRKRAELVPNLVKVVKGYAKHEKGIMNSVTNARKVLLKAKTLQDKMKAGNKLETALGKIFAIAENYPQLKANTNFLRLQEELAAIEDKIAYARQFYNDSVLDYNNSTKIFPGVLFAKLYNAKKKEFLKLPEAKKAVPKIEF